MPTKWFSSIPSLICAVAGWALTGTAHAAEITVMGTQAVKAAYSELVPDFERSSQHKVSTAWVGSSDIMKRMKDGEVVDLVLLASGSIDELVKLGKIVPGSRVDLAKSGVGMAVRAGALKPDISTSEALKRTLLAAKSIGISSGSSANYLVGLFQRMGIADELKPKIKQIAPGLAVGEIVARGEAEIGFQQVSELLPIAGITFVGPLPPDIQNKTLYSGGIHTGAKAPEAATALLQFLKSPAARSAFVKAGMEPSDSP